MREVSDIERRCTTTEAGSHARRSEDITKRLDAAFEMLGGSGSPWRADDLPPP